MPARWRPAPDRLRRCSDGVGRRRRSAAQRLPGVRPVLACRRLCGAAGDRGRLRADRGGGRAVERSPGTGGLRRCVQRRRRAGQGRAHLHAAARTAAVERRRAARSDLRLRPGESGAASPAGAARPPAGEPTGSRRVLPGVAGRRRRRQRRQPAVYSTVLLQSAGGGVRARGNAARHRPVPAVGGGTPAACRGVRRAGAVARQNRLLGALERRADLPARAGWRRRFRGHRGRRRGDRPGAARRRGTVCS